MGIGAIGERDMHGQTSVVSCDRSKVAVMSSGHAIDCGDRRANFIEVYAARYALHEDKRMALARRNCRARSQPKSGWASMNVLAAV